MKKFKIWALVLGAALILVAGFSAELLASKTCCCSQICDQPNMRLVVAADKSPPVQEVVFRFDNLQSGCGWSASTLASIDVEEFDAIVFSAYGELPAVYREFATAATRRSDFRQYAASVNYARDQIERSEYYESRAWVSVLSKSPRDLITDFLAAMRVGGQPSVRASPAVVGRDDEIFSLLDGGWKSKTVRWC